MPIKNVVFDLGNVIIDLDIHRADVALKEMTGIGFSDANGDDLQTFLDFEMGKIEEAIFLNYFIKKAARPIQAWDMINAWNAMLLCIPEPRLDMIATLKNSYRTYFLSNTNETHLRWVDRYLSKNSKKYQSLESLVDKAFYSYKMGCRKPDKSIYTKMLEEGEINPSETIFFDDNADNIEAARLCGIHAILVKPDDEIITLVAKYLNL